MYNKLRTELSLSISEEVTSSKNVVECLKTFQISEEFINRNSNALAIKVIDRLKKNIDLDYLSEKVANELQQDPELEKVYDLTVIKKIVYHIFGEENNK